MAQKKIKEVKSLLLISRAATSASPKRFAAWLETKPNCPPLYSSIRTALQVEGSQQGRRRHTVFLKSATESESQSAKVASTVTTMQRGRTHLLPSLPDALSFKPLRIISQRMRM